MIGANPDGVYSTDSNASESEEHTQSAHSFDWCTWDWNRLLVVVGNQGDSETHGNQRIDCHSWNGFLVEEEVDNRDNGGQEDSGDLVERNCRDLEGDVHANNVHSHCDSEREHIHNGDFSRFEHGDSGTSEDVERRCCYKEVEGCEGCLTL